MSRSGTRRPPTGILVAAEILTAPAVVSSHHSALKNLPWMESEST
jgi:hypothetical protein